MMKRCFLLLACIATVATGEAQEGYIGSLTQGIQKLEARIASVALSQPVQKVSGKQWNLTAGLFPKRLPADGQSVGFIVVKITNKLGQPLRDIPVRFSSTMGRLLTKEARTNGQGIAFARLQSEKSSVIRKVKVHVNAYLSSTLVWNFVPAQPKPRPKFDLQMRVHWMPIVPSENPLKGQWQCVGEDGEVGGVAVPILHISPPPQFCWVDASFKELSFSCPAQEGTMDVKPTFKRDCCVGKQRAAAFRLFVPGGWTRLHNSLYLLRVSATVSDGKHFWLAGEKEMEVKVKNAVLKEITNLSPVLRCEDVGESMTVRFTVDSLQDAPATFRLKLYEWLTDNLVAILEQRQHISPKSQQQFEFTFTLKPEIAARLLDQKPPFLFAYDLEVIVHQPFPEEKDMDYRCSVIVEAGAPVDERDNFITTAEYCGYEDKGTENEEDDEHLFLNPLVLVSKDGSSIKHGKCLLFDPDNEKVHEWEWRSLKCVTHDAYDSTYTSPKGIVHNILIRVPVHAMEKAGTYYWTFPGYDDCAWRYKDHRPRLILEAFRRPFKVRLKKDE